MVDVVHAMYGIRTWSVVCVCECVCMRERERERERERAVSGNALNRTAIGAGPQSPENNVFVCSKVQPLSY